jgi:hypothetical protein
MTHHVKSPSPIWKIESLPTAKKFYSYGLRPGFLTLLFVCPSKIFLEFIFLPLFIDIEGKGLTAYKRTNCHEKDNRHQERQVDQARTPLQNISAYTRISNSIRLKVTVPSCSAIIQKKSDRTFYPTRRNNQNNQELQAIEKFMPPPRFTNNTTPPFYETWHHLFYCQ